MESIGGRTLEGRLNEALSKHGVPAATLGVVFDGSVTVRSAGVARLPSGPPVTNDTLFMVASISKVWTATLVMQLVDDGLVDLDAPANKYLDPPLRLADREVAGSVTVRQLLSHSGGFLGDADEPDAEDDDAVRVTVDSYANLGQLHRPGELFSYSNSGYNVLGRLIECVTGQVWDDALAERLVRPLGLETTCTRLREVATHPLAVGHWPQVSRDRGLAPVHQWRDARGGGPCGTTLATTASELLTFAQMHMHAGLAADGTRVLSTESARLMREPQVTQHFPSSSAAWGLGWAISQLEGPRVVEHTGNSCGHDSTLVVVPEHGLAVCVLTNGDLSGNLRNDLLSQVLADVAGIDRPPPPAEGPLELAPDPTPLLGTYERLPGVLVQVEQGSDGLTLTVDPSDVTGQWAVGFTSPLRHVSEWTYLYRMPLLGRDVVATFLFEGGTDNAGAASHLASGLRVSPRVAT
jgi:CubicO group peptidase (beta-lactamase class C family)